MECSADHRERPTCPIKTSPKSWMTGFLYPCHWTISSTFHSLFKVLFIFPSRYLFAIGLSPVFSLGRNLPPDWGCIPKQPDSPTAPRGATGSEHNGALTLSGAPFQGTWARSAAEDASPDYNSETPVKAPDSQAGLFPVRSPLLGESL